MTFAYKATHATLNFLTRFMKADLRVHNVDVIKDDLSIIFVANHFTRLETILNPFEIGKRTGREFLSLAAGDLFQGRVGEFLTSVGCISTKDPDRDKLIIRELLVGERPWIIFPEGSMIKDKKTVNDVGEFEIYHEGERRRPFSGAAVLAMQAEFYRQKMLLLHRDKNDEELAETLRRFELESIDEIKSRRTVIIPVNITYYPIRTQDNPILKLAQKMNDNLSERAIEELSVEGTFLAGDCDIDMSFGEPIDVQTYLSGPEFDDAIALNHGHQTEDNTPKVQFRKAAHGLMLRYMADIYRLTTINLDHIFATIIRYQGPQAFTERAYRNRIFLAVHTIVEQGTHRLHTILKNYYRGILYEDPSPKFEDFMNLCIEEGIIVRKGRRYKKNLTMKQGLTGFHRVRQSELNYVIANEIEPLGDITEVIKSVALMPRPQLSQMVREIIVREDQELFEGDYKNHFEEGVSKEIEVGRPFLLVPDGKLVAGIVMVHGYLAAPREIRGLAEYFKSRGFAVYGVRLKGHGTAPRDLGHVNWEDWYESLNRGYAAIKSLTDNIIIGGFSTGGALALLAAGRKADKICATFSINAPLHLRNYASHLIPSINTVNAILARVNIRRPEWEYLENQSESPDINYLQNPVSGVSQLNECIKEMERGLKNIIAPTLILQGSRDPVVDPVSAHLIFNQMTCRKRELTYFDRDRHGMINGDGAVEIFERIEQFIQWSRKGTECSG